MITFLISLLEEKPNKTFLYECCMSFWSKRTIEKYEVTRTFGGKSNQVFVGIALMF